jgi:hypothetical protein
MRRVQAHTQRASGILSGRLGQSTVALTLEICSRVLPQADQEAADRIAALIEC